MPAYSFSNSMTSPLVYVIFPEKKPQHGPDAYDWWRQEGRSLGMYIKILFADDIDCACFKRPNAVVMRHYSEEISQHFANVPIFSPWSAMAASRDKATTARILTDSGVNTPKTLSLTPCSTFASIVAEIGCPFVAKPRCGSQGRGVTLVANENDFQNILHTTKENFVAQQYISTSHGRDIRVWVIDNEVVGAVVRSNPNRLASNYSLGGSAKLLDGPNESVYSLALSAVKALGLFFAGVDILFGPDKTYTVCEVNGNAGFRTLSQCAPQNNIVRKLLEAVRQHIIE